MFNLKNLELDPNAARQYIDARTAFVELERTRKTALQVRGGMVWQTVDGKDTRSGPLQPAGKRAWGGAQQRPKLRIPVNTAARSSANQPPVPPQCPPPLRGAEIERPGDNRKQWCVNLGAICNSTMPR